MNLKKILKIEQKYFDKSKSALSTVLICVIISIAPIILLLGGLSSLYVCFTKGTLESSTFININDINDIKETNGTYYYTNTYDSYYLFLGGITLSILGIGSFLFVLSQAYKSLFYIPTMKLDYYEIDQIYYNGTNDELEKKFSKFLDKYNL